MSHGASFERDMGVLRALSALLVVIPGAEAIYDSRYDEPVCGSGGRG